MIIVGVYTRFEPQYGTKQKLKRSRLWNLIMEIEVQFFALYRERAGCRRASLELPTGATVEDLTTEVRRRYPGLAPAEVRIVVAVNTDYAEPETVLKERDEVCLIPPVSGG